VPKLFKEEAPKIPNKENSEKGLFQTVSRNFIKRSKNVTIYHLDRQRK